MSELYLRDRQLRDRCSRHETGRAISAAAQQKLNQLVHDFRAKRAGGRAGVVLRFLAGNCPSVNVER